MPNKHFDLVILGSGSTAFAAALRAQEFGKIAVMTEERTTGGTCVNRGCLPSKNLIEAAKIIHDARHPRYPGVSPAELGLDFRKLIEQKDDVIHGYRRKKYESLTGGQFTIETGHAEFVDDHTVQVDGKRLTGDKILIATGARPVIPEIDGFARGAIPHQRSADHQRSHGAAGTATLGHHSRCGLHRLRVGAKCCTALAQGSRFWSVARSCSPTAHDGRGSQNRRHFPLQRPPKAFVLRELDSYL